MIGRRRQFRSPERQGGALLIDLLLSVAIVIFAVLPLLVEWQHADERAAAARLRRCADLIADQYSGELQQDAGSFLQHHAVVRGGPPARLSVPAPYEGSITWVRGGHAAGRGDEELLDRIEIAITHGDAASIRQLWVPAR